MKIYNISKVDKIIINFLNNLNNTPNIKPIQYAPNNIRYYKDKKAYIDYYMKNHNRYELRIYLNHTIYYIMIDLKYNTCIVTANQILTNVKVYEYDVLTTTIFDTFSINNKNGIYRFQKFITKILNILKYIKD